MTIRILTGDCREVLKTLPAGSVHTCVTSPPYFGLRDYGTASWEGGDPACDHDVRRWEGPKQTQGAQSGHASKADRLARKHCKCGAKRVDNQIGLEETIDEYVENLVLVFREVYRVLHDDGTLWLNLGDSYASNGGHSAQGVTSARIGRSNVDDQNRVRGFRPGINVYGIKPKNILGIPWRVAFALQQDGWNLRQDIVWAKTQPMPESVTDRFTRAHEYIFMFTKSGRYFFDQEAVKEDAVSDHASGNGFAGRQGGSEHMPMSGGAGTEAEWVPGGKRNKRSVWTVGTETFSWEFCTSCRRLYDIAEKNRLPVDTVGGAKARRCRCGRNDAWLSHFATFPPSLIEPAILAGTSEKGHCPACGAGRARVLEKMRENLSNAAKAGTEIAGKGHVSTQVRENHDIRNGPVITTKTVGWKPTCSCGIQTSDRGVVLDPFFGAGTTGLVADRLGRDCIGIELNADYADLAENRLRRDGGLLVEIEREDRYAREPC